jgi:hypothetical protein
LRLKWFDVAADLKTSWFLLPAREHRVSGGA